MPFVLLIVPIMVAGLVSSWALAPTTTAFSVGVVLILMRRIPAKSWLHYLVRPLFIPPPSLHELADFLTDMANHARRDGILSLEKVKIEFPPLLIARNHCVDGMDPETLAFAMKRERRMVTRQVSAIRTTLEKVFGITTLTICFLLVEALWRQDGTTEGSRALLGYGVTLFLILVGHVATRGHLKQLEREMDEIYRMITDGMTGIQKGISPRMLQTILLGGLSFRWQTTEDKPSGDRVWDDVTDEQIAQKLHTYLETIHPRFRHVEAWSEQPEREGDEQPGKDEGEGWERFYFNDLLRMDDRSFQTLLREIGDDELTTALKGATPEIIRQTLANLSNRAADDLLWRLEWLGKPPKETIEQAQRTILKTARQLESEGAIVIMGKTSP